MNLWLISTDGRAGIAIDRALIIIGRHGQCDLRLDSQRVSRRHCCLAPDRGGILVRDLNSTNGTRINGRPIDSGLLRLGDVLEVAHYCFLLEVRPEPAAEPAVAIACEPPAPGGQHPETLPDHPEIAPDSPP